MSMLDRRTVVAGALSGLFFAVPASLLRATIFDGTGMAGVMVAVVFFAAALAGYGAARPRPRRPLTHGALAGGVTFVGAQLVFSIAKGDAPNPIGIVISLLMFASLGTIGAYVAVLRGAQPAPTGGER
jgi:putative membrane protein (TIGR04086 family)